MKFTKENASTVTVFGMDIIDYCHEAKKLPIDCAIAKFRNSEYPWKINRNFHEMFFVLNGECEVIFRDQTFLLKEATCS